MPFVSGLAKKLYSPIAAIDNERIHNDRKENPEPLYVNLNLPVTNISITFTIPPNTSDYTIPVNTPIPMDKFFYRWVSDITYRVDTSGLYNVTSTQTITYVDGTGTHTITIQPGYYPLPLINTLLSPQLINPIQPTGPNAFLAIEAPGVLSINLTLATQIASILGWPLTVGAGFIPGTSVDVTQSKDLMLIYLSFCKQSSENNYTNVAAIPIVGTIGTAISGNYHSKTPLLPGLNSISNPTIRVRDILNRPFTLNTPIFINCKILFAIKNHNQGFNTN